MKKECMHFLNTYYIWTFVLKDEMQAYNKSIEMQ